MASSKTASKNSRTSATSSKAAAIQGDVKLLIPCNAGRNAYVRNLKTQTNPNLATDSGAFVAAVRGLAETGHGPKVRAELSALATSFPQHGWAGVLARLDAADAFVAAA
jgi:hypothetical protein